MNLLIQLLVIILAFISHKHEAIAQSPNTYTSLVFPVTKHTDTTKPLYSVRIKATDYMDTQSSYSNYLIDIDAPVIWHDCIPDWKTYPVPCHSENEACMEVQPYSYKNPSCHPNSNRKIPGWGYCSCPVNVVNPVTGSCENTVFNYDYFTMNTSNGKNVLNGVYGATPTGSCASSSSFKSFPKDVKGVMTFSSSPYALPASLNLYGELVKKITALCLPSKSSAPGVLFTGTGPYYLLPQSNVDIRSLLSYTPLLDNPNSFGYFISIKAIVIKNRSINIPADATTKLSTTEPYTTLRTDIFTRVARRFSMVTKRIPTAKPIAPFDRCFRRSTNGTKVGFKVPNIDFSLQGGKTWTISTANSIKQMTKDVACLALVDGGATSVPAITIGTFQFEDNFVVFDLENSTFGFSSSLLSKKTSCANFNFTQLM
ncbi:aspartic peptidase A1 family [Artemisia annua]|uniref:Aspartic peptidase A1 family n=1 Tax=Artemisia annua TaxID=35608 RepID=A0A2U1LYL4_ARTAN|nr:aspartic peptidase A1 family [Artemisia annua]